VSNGVKFGAGYASFSVVTDTYLTAVVPTSETTGAVSVTAPSGMLSSNNEFKRKRR
jgi:hypothetical protein